MGTLTLDNNGDALTRVHRIVKINRVFIAFIKSL